MSQVVKTVPLVVARAAVMVTDQRGEARRPMTETIFSCYSTLTLVHPAQERGSYARMEGSRSTSTPGDGRIFLNLHSPLRHPASARRAATLSWRNPDAGAKAFSGSG